MKQDGLWIAAVSPLTPVIAVFPLRTEKQKTVLQFFNWLSNDHDNLIKQTSYEELRLLWRSGLAQHRLSSTKSWRYLYAKQMYDNLLTEFGNYKTCLMIRDDMGIKKRNTLWQYLKA